MNESLIERAIILPRLGASERDGAFAEIVDAMVAAGALAEKAKKPILKQLLQREKRGSTGLGNGVAVPHVKEADVTDVLLGFAISEDGIPFEAIDGRAVRTLFMVLGPKGAPPEDHLQVLRWVSQLARNADFRRFALISGGVDELRELLLEMTHQA